MSQGIKPGIGPLTVARKVTSPIRESQADGWRESLFSSRSGKLLQQSLAFAEPWALAALHIARQSAFFCKQFLSPFARFVVAVRDFQKTDVVVKSFGSRRNLYDLCEQRFGAIHLARASVRIR